MHNILAYSVLVCICHQADCLETSYLEFAVKFQKNKFVRSHFGMLGLLFSFLIIRSW